MSSYQDYLQSDEWKRRAKMLKQKVGWRCADCNRMMSEHKLHVHHLTYERLGNEAPGDLRVLCFQCHQKTHSRKVELTHAEKMKRLADA